MSFDRKLPLHIGSVSILTASSIHTGWLQAQLDASMAEQGILPIIHPDAFYSNPADVPDRPVVFAGLQFRVPSSAVGNLPLFTRDPAAGRASASTRLILYFTPSENHPLNTTQC